jgi:hypothetical protein
LKAYQFLRCTFKRSTSRRGSILYSNSFQKGLQAPAFPKTLSVSIVFTIMLTSCWLFFFSLIVKSKCKLDDSRPWHQIVLIVIEPLHNDIFKRMPKTPNKTKHRFHLMMPFPKGSMTNFTKSLPLRVPYFKPSM